MIARARGLSRHERTMMKIAAEEARKAKREKIRAELQRIVIDRATWAGFFEDAAWVIGMISRADQAWIARSNVDGMLVAVDELSDAGILEAWTDSPDGEAVTFTPYGAALFGLAIVEEWEKGEGTIPKTGETYTGLIETPLWEDAGRASQRPPLELPKYAREIPLESPESIVDDAPGPDEEYVIDGESGEPVRLFGRTIAIDRRMKTNKAG